MFGNDSDEWIATATLGELEKRRFEIIDEQAESEFYDDPITAYDERLAESLSRINKRIQEIAPGSFQDTGERE